MKGVLAVSMVWRVVLSDSRGCVNSYAMKHRYGKYALSLRPLLSPCTTAANWFRYSRKGGGCKWYVSSFRLYRLPLSMGWFADCSRNLEISIRTFAQNL